MVFQKKAERLKRAIEQLSAEATHVREFTRARVLELAGSDVGLKTFYRIFPDKQFLLLRQAWLHRRIEEAIDVVFAQACAQRDVTIQRIADLAGCHVGCVTRQAGPQIQQRLLNLPDSQEQMVLAIQRLVAARIPLHKLTWARVYAEAAERPMKANARVVQTFHNGREALIQYHEQQRLQRVPNATYACIQGEWINVDEPVWRLSSRGKTLRRDRLRPDIASTVWLLLREEALTTDVAAATLVNHYQIALAVATLLGETIPDICTLTLASIQQVWCRYEVAVPMRRRVRTMLVRILEKQLLQEPGEDPLRRQEYVRAIQWLRTICLRRPPSEKAFLSETEFDAVLDACLEDIVQGFTYLQHVGQPLGRGAPLFTRNRPNQYSTGALDFWFSSWPLPDYGVKAWFDCKPMILLRLVPRLSLWRGDMGRLAKNRLR